ncbi:WD40 repeat-like protein [Basidiobolus meristosporus CBS 931.73]|uniref:Pre-mRNA-processing factor 19 n=1 Tax=Basidiobolus meristosporus CBS 931.73 TaxID=1314790 RepID=A0A1Y1Z4H6_9FUNG|nr:WD40 repeat-like protein [Basidiobolus meristosporus CBS 931.73]|eukprot:ORY05096.1 WD40 repeat-like protein [Basidiobolus meristosporus CBS 931.73]
MFCAISGEAPEVPVVSSKSGHVFEKRLIIKYLAENDNKCPITGEELTEQDLVEVKSVPKMVKPRTPTMTSIPSMLASFQNEWDSLMLETYTLKQQYQQVRQELSHALYQQDAACRVIARVTKERDAAREALVNLRAHLDSHAQTAPDNGDVNMDTQEEGLTNAVIEKLTQTSQALSKTRKKRKAPAELTSVDAVRSYTQTSVVPALHSSTAPGITCLDLDATNKLVLTGGHDKIAQIYKQDEEKTVAELKGHTKRITDVLFQGAESGVALTSSADKTVKVWKPEGSGYACVNTIDAHESEVTSITLHPSKEFLVSSSQDSTWAFHDLGTGRTLSKVSTADVQTGYSCAQFHPDGLILGTGTNDSAVRIWDVKSQSNVATFAGHTGRVTSLSFSENGYYLATSSEDNLVKLWDLRKLVNFKTLELPQNNKVNVVNFDYSGQYLAVGGTDVRVFKVKEWDELAVLSDNTAEVNDLSFGEYARFLVSGGMDRSLRYFGPGSSQPMETA